MAKNEMSRSGAVVAKTMYLALQILHEHGGELPGSEVLDEIGRKAQFDEWERGIYEKTGNTRWRSIFHFHSIGAIKTGLMTKRRGIWYLTPEGEQALKLTPEELRTFINDGYRKWREANPKSQEPGQEDEVLIEQSSTTSTQEAELTLEWIEDKAIVIIKNFVYKKNPYEFQDLCAALLRGMGYYTPFVAPKGKDGGVDVIAYRDPLGTTTPRIKVQVKHKPDTSSGSKDIRELLGVLQKDGDVGIFISSGGFSPDAKQTASSSSIHVELIDLDRFIDLWQEFYNKLSDEDKAYLPLNPVYVLSLGE
jgi:restriction system protein